MIQYDPHRWFDHFFDVRGSLIKEISGRVLVCGVWAAGVIAFHYNVRPVATSLALHSLVGTALGLLLVFRTNASYDRYWEGRRLWGDMINGSRNLVRVASIHLASDEELFAQLTRWTVIFA